MGKAITEVGLIVAAATVDTVLALTDPWIGADPLLMHAVIALNVAAVGAAAGLISQAVSHGPGTEVASRQAANHRSILYGESRIGGTLIYEAITGHQLNQVFCFAWGQCLGPIAVYLDGRQVFFEDDSVTQTTTGPGGTVNSGGNSDGTTRKDQFANDYNFGGLVYFEWAPGTPTQAALGGLIAQRGSDWASSDTASGNAVGYLKCTYDANQFASGPPQVRVTWLGRNTIYDPRSATYGYTCNAALVIADLLMNSDYGFGYAQSQIDMTQLIAAANVCDEQIELPTALGIGTESQFTINGVFDTSTGPGDVLNMMLQATGFRISEIAGKVYIWPAAFVAPSITLNEGQLIDAPEWSPNRSYKDLFNSVRGTFIAPKYPYSVVGNYYDSNGFDQYGNTEGNFDYDYEPTNYPPYACDTLHGYPSDAYLAQDNGNLLTKDLSYLFCNSIGQAQRVAKIALLRNRFQGTGKLTFQLAAYQLQPNDTFFMSFPALGWGPGIGAATAGVGTLTQGVGAVQWQNVANIVSPKDFASVTVGGNNGVATTQAADPANLAKSVTLPPGQLLVVTANASFAAAVPYEGYVAFAGTLAVTASGEVFADSAAQVNCSLDGGATWINTGFTLTPAAPNPGFITFFDTYSAGNLDSVLIELQVLANNPATATVPLTISGSLDNLQASYTTIDPGPGTSPTLAANSLAMSLPAEATYAGISLYFSGYYTGQSACAFTVQLTVGGLPVGNAITAELPAQEESGFLFVDEQFGITALNASQVAGLGVDFTVSGGSAAAASTAYLHNRQLSVSYTTPGSPHVLEVQSMKFTVKAEEAEPPTFVIEMQVAESDPSIYEWSAVEQLSPTDTPYAGAISNGGQYKGPTGLALECDSTTAYLGADGVVYPRILASWTAPDPLTEITLGIQVQWQVDGWTNWTDSSEADVSQTSTLIGGIASGQTINVRVRSLGAGGQYSPWDTVTGFGVPVVLSAIGSQGLGVGLIYGTAFGCTITVTSTTSTVPDPPHPPIVTYFYYCHIDGPGGSGSSFTAQLGSTTVVLPGGSLYLGNDDGTGPTNTSFIVWTVDPGYTNPYTGWVNGYYSATGDYSDTIGDNQIQISEVTWGGGLGGPVSPSPFR